MSELKPGDVVRLKSGGPLMTVGSLYEGMVYTSWFSGDAKKTGEFYPISLEVVEDKILKYALDHNAHLNIFRFGAKSTDS